MEALQKLHVVKAMEFIGQSSGKDKCTFTAMKTRGSNLVPYLAEDLVTRASEGL